MRLATQPLLSGTLCMGLLVAIGVQPSANAISTAILPTRLPLLALLASHWIWNPIVNLK